MPVEQHQTITSEEEDRCLVHARVAARQAVLKGMDREARDGALMIEAVKLVFGVDDPDAARLAQRWKEETFRQLDADYVTHTGAEGRPKVVRLLRPVSRERLLTSTALSRAS